jgi:tRNA threonylcarbamoyladenosine biosynthesis protein TsaB
MMLLALESATIEVGVALRDSSGLLAALVARPGRRHVETLHPAVEAVCAAANTTLAGVGAVAVDVGPGLFTGVRVGVAAAKAFAFALEVPVVACTSTEVLAHAARDAGPDVVPVVDMRRGEVAWVMPTGAATDEAGIVLAGDVLRIRLGTVEELADEIAGGGDRPLLIVGDGARRHGAAICDAVTARGGRAPRLAGDALGAPPVASLADLALLRFDAGLRTTAVDVAPVYLRAPDTRINWASRPVAPGGAAAARGGSDRP